jgi:hypothetical protein
MTRHDSVLFEGVVVLFLLGWVTQAVIGQFYKITPFLMWYYRATIPDVLAIPRQPAQYNPPLGRLVLWLSNAGVVTLSGGIWLGVDSVARGGAVLVALAAWILAYVLAYRWVPPALSSSNGGGGSRRCAPGTISSRLPRPTVDHLARRGPSPGLGPAGRPPATPAHRRA